MKTFFRKLIQHRGEIIMSSLNLGGTALVVVGVSMLPIDLSFRFIILGVCALALWKTVSN